MLGQWRRAYTLADTQIEVLRPSARDWKLKLDDFFAEHRKGFVQGFDVLRFPAKPPDRHRALFRFTLTHHEDGRNFGHTMLAHLV